MSFQVIILIFGILYVLNGLFGCTCGSAKFLTSNTEWKYRTLIIHLFTYVNALILGTLTILAIALQKSWLLGPTIIHALIRIVAQCFYIVITFKGYRNEDDANEQDERRKRISTIGTYVIAVILDMIYMIVAILCVQVLNEKSDASNWSVHPSRG
ncbi:hypothetical protein QR680_000278 [Steinernema hermaphroditum]|uniref:Uncharacterized protein n=1 Tax=Steinernema hermaphroditum TaxID=289476 RepID=A0AA39GW33_9BILA|nr:hypothetical protein QR680_000278 [Steinernema hermaphroditum]